MVVVVVNIDAGVDNENETKLKFKYGVLRRWPSPQTGKALNILIFVFAVTLVQGW